MFFPAKCCTNTALANAISQKIHVGGIRIMYIEMIVSSGRLQAPEPYPVARVN